MTLHIPPGAVERPRSRLLDWRFLAALAGLLFVALLGWFGWRNYEIRESEAAQKDALIGELSDRSREIDQLNNQIAALLDRAREDRKSSSRERDRMLRQQEAMIRLLRSVGVEPSAGGASPQQYLTRPSKAPSRGSSRHSGATVDNRGGGGGGERPAGPEPTPAPEPSPNPEPAPVPLLPELDLPPWLPSLA